MPPGLALYTHLSVDVRSVLAGIISRQKLVLVQINFPFLLFSSVVWRRGNLVMSALQKINSNNMCPDWRKMNLRKIGYVLDFLCESVDRGSYSLNNREYWRRKVYFWNKHINILYILYSYVLSGIEKCVQKKIYRSYNLYYWHNN